PQVRQRFREVALQVIRPAELAERMLVIEARAAPLVDVYRAPLQRERSRKVSQARVTQARIVQRGRIFRESLEGAKRQHALEPRQRLVEPASDDAAHAEIVQRPNLMKAIAPAFGLLDRSREPGLALGPAAEAKGRLPGQDVDVEVDVRSRGKRAGVVE